MASIKMRPLLLAVIIGLGAVFVSIGVLGMSPALAGELEVTGSASLAPRQQAQPYEFFAFGVVFTDPAIVQITDLSGNVVGEGVHVGSVKCNRDNCSKTTQLDFTIWFADPRPNESEYEYKFKTLQALDPEEERVVVAGTGTISSRDQQERFRFTATFQNNRDGTVSVTYVASRPDASFVIPKTLGTFTIYSKP